MLTAYIATREGFRPYGALVYALLFVGHGFRLQDALAPAFAAPTTVFVCSARAASGERQTVVCARESLNPEALVMSGSM